MAHVINFHTSRFAVAAETPNPINPIFGQSVLRWLRESLGASGYETTEPAPEDWGWYMDAKGGGASYLVGASGDAAEDGTGRVDWTIQIEKHRSLKERITGGHRLGADDPLSAVIERLVREDAGAAEIEVDREEP
jgi:hypothetical protein